MTYYQRRNFCEMYAEQVYTTLVDLIQIPSTSGHEEQIRAYLSRYLEGLRLATQVDSVGNLIVTLPGEGKPLLLNAHMDRVPPGLGHHPVLRDGVLYSDGTTNLGADDAAGVTIILEVVRRLVEQQKPHPPLVLVFTVQEETGLCGASGFDCAAWQVEDGIVFDNAFEAGVVVSRGAAYEAFDVHISGRTGHPGKDLAHTVDALTIFREARYPRGSRASDQTRIHIGRISGGSARNAIPDAVLLEGELRSFEGPEARERYRQEIESAFTEAARRRGGSAEVSFKTHSQGYEVHPDEPLLHVYRAALEERGATLRLQPTFIGSDASGFRATARVFVISTGVVNEHSIEEYVALEPLEQLVADTLRVLELWQQRTK
jgi:tripeptide aminopeptidase